jgi:hypothetical protein
VIILDTDVVSALMRQSTAIDSWLQTVAPEDLHLTTMTRAEIRYGIARLPQGNRRKDLSERADRLFAETRDRLLSFDGRAADRYGALVAQRAAAGRPISVLDAIIASIAFVHRASLATRNVRDFELAEIDVIDPFGS